jgi:hypothetical protein
MKICDRCGVEWDAEFIVGVRTFERELHGEEEEVDSCVTCLCEGDVVIREASA